MARSMGSHHRPNEGKSNDWLTPPEIIKAYGPFDLDPCASVDQPWKTAERQWTEHGLESPWEGLVWCNPPYGPHVWEWLGRMADWNNGIALIFARTETEGFFREVWRRATAIRFLEGRLHFHWPVSGDRAAFNAGAPSVLVGYGAEAARRLRGGLPGQFIRLRKGGA